MRLAEVLTDTGHDAVHVKTAIALDAADEDVFEHARLDQRVHRHRVRALPLHPSG